MALTILGQWIDHTRVQRLVNNLLIAHILQYRSNMPCEWPYMNGIWSTSTMSFWGFAHYIVFFFKIINFKFLFVYLIAILVADIRFIGDFQKKKKNTFPPGSDEMFHLLVGH